MTRRTWDDFSDDELERVASGRATRYDIEQERRQANLQGAEGEFGSFLSSAGDSLSFGFGDEFMGLGAGIGAAAGGGDFGQAYRQQADRSRQRLRDAWRYHSGSALGGAIVGALPLGGALGLAARGARAASALRNLTPLQRAITAGASGSGVGAVYGVGSDNDDRLTGEGITNRLKGAGLGAALGFGTGAALQGLGMGLRHAGRSVIGPMLDPTERAAQEIGKAVNRSSIPEEATARGITVEQEIARRAREAQRMEQFSPGSNPLLMDVLDSAGPDMAMVAGSRQSAGRRELQQTLLARNEGARERVDAMLVRDLGGGRRRTVAQSWEELEQIKRKNAAPDFAAAMQQTVQAVPRQLRDFVTFNSRTGARFHAAVEGARESMRRLARDPGLADDAMMRSPRFWHFLQENVSAEVNALYKAARMTPLQGPRGSAVAEMVADDQLVNRAVRRMLGTQYNRAMETYAGASRLQNAWELGYDAVRMDGGEFQLAEYARQLSRMSAAEREAVRDAAISGLRRELGRDPGTGRADVLRNIIGNENKRNVMRAIFGGEARLGRVMRALEYERRLFQNYADTNIGRNSPTADKLQGAEQMFGMDGTPVARMRRAFGRDAQAIYDEELANSVLRLLGTPLTGAQAPANVAQHVTQTGLLSRSLRRAADQRNLRQEAGPAALIGGGINSLGISPNELFAY